MNCVGILDVLTFDSQGNPLAAIQHYQVKDSIIVLKMPATLLLTAKKFFFFITLIFSLQQDDLMYLGKVVLALACNTVMAIKRDNFQNSMELIARSYSADLKNFFL